MGEAISDDIMAEARTAYLKANQERVCVGGALGLERAAEVIARAILAERERCAERFLTFTDLAAEGDNALSIVHITRGLRAIRNRP